MMDLTPEQIRDAYDLLREPDAEDCERFTSRYGQYLLDLATGGWNGHYSDCPTNNPPALPRGRCDCLGR